MTGQVIALADRLQSDPHMVSTFVGETAVMLTPRLGAGGWYAWASRFDTETMTNVIREAHRDTAVDALKAALQSESEPWMAKLARRAGAF